MDEFIQFKRSRDLGRIITDIFKFLRHNYKVLFGLIFRIAGPALILLVVAYVFYMESAMNAFDPYASDPDLSGGFVSLLGSLLVFLLAAGLYYALLYGTVLNCIKSYVNNKGVIDKTEVISGVKENFWGLIGLSILNGLIVGAGLMVCFFPGVYLGVVVITTYMIMVFEKRGASDSISYSFELIKGQWWTTFATLIVVWVIYYVVLFIFQVPQYIYFFTKEFTVSETYIEGSPVEAFDWIDMALSSFGVIAQYLLQTFLVLASAFIYFNLNEKKNFTGTMETIESLGNREE
ncbi:MAG: hypothetical protein KJO05_00235 [Bacteroidia bacterium]|nr:hypothetical protein [Bacteroidia bacterium]MBT8275424.1 hypothetical protein [Bacteroidia bacterium]NNF30870.1 hypothetical protein [Flavobacteriaceae bacterium]NNK54483.1 hypothetical protein [Flavobacteriaceae bacterium]NNM08045.1 hypothetical protein [Flavobacteriaceae bacterium]